MHNLEKRFLIAVERGDLDTVKSMLGQQKTRDHPFDKNCFDPLGRNALVIAIDNQNLEMVKYLLESGIRLCDALLYAIDENFVEAVELILDYEAANSKPGEPPSWEQDRENSFFSADMSPLILAAHRNNFEIIKILLMRQVAPIVYPHEPRCACKTCSQARADDCLKHSRARINAYRALASPCWMALSSPDPLLTAFELSAKLEDLARMEPEYKQDYLSLRVQCQKFATKLLDHTRTTRELEILLNYSDEYHHDLGNSNGADQFSLQDLSRFVGTSGDSCNSIEVENDRTMNSGMGFLSSGYNNQCQNKRFDSMLSLDSVTGRHESYRSSMRLARLRLAIQCKQKTFCAHPNIQELLATMWYENLPGFRNKSILAQISQVLCIGLLFPIYSIAYLLAPNTQLGRYIKRPFVKFICHSASYITFLIVLILASQRVEAFYCWPSLLDFLGITSYSSGAGSSINGLSSANFANLSLFTKQFFTSSASPPNSNNFDDADISTLAAIYKQLGGSPNGARGLDSLSKIFEQMPASAKKRGTLPSPIEVLILIWVISLLWAEIKQIKALGMNYYKEDMWNILDSVANGCYIGTIALRIVSYVQSDESSMEVAREHWHAYDPLLLSEGLFAAATIFSALKLVYIFSINPYLGPLQISLGRMIIDILRFSWIYMLVLFAFACGMNQLLWYYADLERHQCLNVTNYSLAQYYAQRGVENSQTLSVPTSSSSSSVSTTNATTTATSLVDLLMASNASIGVNATTQPPTSTDWVPSAVTTNATADEKLMEDALTASLEDDSTKPPVTIDDSCKTWRHFSNVFESLQTLFWANFGLVDLENFDLTGIRQYTRFWALLMFGCYCFINVIVVLNLLIAMMNHSYVKISKRSDIEWKFARTRLWMSYFDTGSTVPAPFNVIPSVKSFRNLIMAFFRLIGWIFSKISDALYAMCCIWCHRAEIKDSNNNCDTNDATICNESVIIPTNQLPLRCKQRVNTTKRQERAKRHYYLTANYRNVIRTLVRRYLINEQRLIEKKSILTEAKLNRWAKLNAFD